MKIRSFRLTVALFVCIAYTQLLNAQYRFSITVEMPFQFENDTISIDINNILENQSYKKIVKNGVVNLTGIMQTRYSSAYLYLTKNSIWSDTSFYFGIKPVKVICKKTGSSLNPFLRNSFKNVYFQDLTIRLNDTVAFENAATLTAYKDFKNAENSQKDSLKNIFLYKRKIYENKILDFIKNNNHSYFAFAYFNGYFVNRADYSNSDSLLTIFYNIFPKKFINSKEGRAIENILIAKKQILNGSIAPDFVTKGIDNKSIEFKKPDSTRYTLLQFWASWCAPCIREIPLIKNFRKKYSESKLRIISVSIDIDSSKWKASARKQELQWENANDLDIQKKYGVTSIPVIYLISPKGIILYNNLENNDTDLLEKLSSLLKESL